MPTRKKGMLVLALVALGGTAALSLSQGQESPQVNPSGITTRTPPPVAEVVGVRRDLPKLPVLQQQMYLMTERAGDWLRRANRTDGRFVYGYLPDLKTPLDGDHYLSQAGAAFALARVARFLGDDRAAAVARQAVLTLLLDTSLDPDDAKVRRTALPSAMVNRLAAAGLLVMSIHELPAPGDDLLEQAEQLCAYIRKQQNADGSLSITDSGASAAVDPDGVNLYPGPALCGLMCSQRHRPAAWKTEVVRKALPFYAACWRTHKNMAFIPWQTTAYVEAFLLTKEPVFAEFVVELADWLSTMQYAQLDPRHPLWNGGFMELVDGKSVSAPPQVTSAAYAMALSEASRVVRQTADLTRYQRYRTSVERCLQFLSTLQYTDANTQHFADWYRPVLVGGFHASHQDGNLRIDYTQYAVCALIGYLSAGVD